MAYYSLDGKCGFYLEGWGSSCRSRHKGRVQSLRVLLPGQEGDQSRGVGFWFVHSELHNSGQLQSWTGWEAVSCEFCLCSWILVIFEWVDDHFEWVAFMTLERTQRTKTAHVNRILRRPWARPCPSEEQPRRPPASAQGEEKFGRSRFAQHFVHRLDLPRVNFWHLE